MKITKYLFRAVGFVTLIAASVYAEEHSSAPKRANMIYDIRMGILAHDVEDLWSGTNKEDGVDINSEVVFNVLNHEFFSGTVRPNLGMSLNSSGQTSKLYVGLLWESRAISGFLINLGAGLAIHDGERDTNDPNRKSLGSRVLFRIPIELGFELSPNYRLFVSFDHVSNAYLFRPNEGMDTLGIRLGYRF